MAKFPPFIIKQIHNLCASRVEGITDSGVYFDQPTMERIRKNGWLLSAVQKYSQYCLSRIRDCFIDKSQLVYQRK